MVELRTSWIGVTLGEDSELVGLLAIGRDEDTAAALNCADHAVDMIVADSTDGELDGVFWRGLPAGGGLHGVVDDARPLWSCKRSLGKSGEQTRSA